MSFNFNCFELSMRVDDVFMYLNGRLQDLVFEKLQERVFANNLSFDSDDFYSMTFTTDTFPDKTECEEAERQIRNLFLLMLFIENYITAMLWTEELEEWDMSDIELSSFNHIVNECTQFFKKASFLLNLDDVEEIKIAGHDFWLTRNGHGSGFWDRDESTYNGNGDKLTKIAKKFGSSDVVFDEENECIDVIF